MPGVIPMLRKLALPKSIGTNGPRDRALEALRMTGLEPFFGDRLTTYEDVKNPKPAPDVYQLAAGAPASNLPTAWWWKTA